MIDDKIIEKTYIESLEERIIKYIHERMKISWEEAMDVYYNSKISEKIQVGAEGIQYLDYKNLGDLIIQQQIG